MKLKKQIAWFSAFSLAAALVLPTVVACANNSADTKLYENIKVISTNDMHGRLDKNEDNKEAGIQALSGYVKAQQPDLLLDAGDMTQGTALNDVDKGKTMAKAAKIMNYDAIAIGNHEFDFGLENLQDTIKNVNGNFLSANVRSKQEGTQVFNGTKIKTLANGLKVGIIGLTTPETAYKTHPNYVKNLVFTKLIEEGRTQINALERQGIKFIVVVSHVGEYDTVPLAQALENKIDLIIDGHSHLNFQQTVGTTQIIQTGEYTKALRNSQFNFNSQTGFIENFQSNLIDFNELIKFENQADPKIQTIVNALKAQQEIELKKVVVQNNPYDLIGDRKQVRYRETNLGDLATDAMFKKAKEAVPDLDFALTNSGGIRQNLLKGVITKRNTYDVFPFGNRLVVLEAKGSVLRQAFDLSVKQGVGTGALLQVSENVKLTEQNDGQWTYQIKKDGTFTDLDNNQIYKFATQDFTQSGGDGYDIFRNLKELFSGSDIKEVLEGYLQELESTNGWEKYKNPLPNERLVFLDPNPPAPVEPPTKPKN